VAKKSNHFFRYRDTLTGRFASKRSWKGSKTQGGTRFKRESVGKKKTTKKKVPQAGFIFRLTYKQSKSSHLLESEFTFKAPHNVTRKKVEKVLREWVVTDELPNGWEAPNFIDWNSTGKGGKNYPADDAGVRSALDAVLNDETAETETERESDGKIIK
jgi:hypothetical protein